MSTDGSNPFPWDPLVPLKSHKPAASLCNPLPAREISSAAGLPTYSVGNASSQHARCNTMSHLTADAVFAVHVSHERPDVTPCHLTAAGCIWTLAGHYMRDMTSWTRQAGRTCEKSTQRRRRLRQSGVNRGQREHKGSLRDIPKKG